MKLLVGLGNPGKEYIGTRHNLGYAAVSALRKAIASRNRWRKDERFQSELSENTVSGETVVLMRPLTFMNRSGEAVARFVEEERMMHGDVWIIQDELDLPLGQIKITLNSSAAGHRGIESIHEALGTKTIPRFRLGIAPESGARQLPADIYVLEKFPKSERRIVELVITTAVEAMRVALSQGLHTAMTRYNGKPIFRQSRISE